jgi:hypothetical protein
MRGTANVAARIDANRAALSVARKLARRSHHILRALGDQAILAFHCHGYQSGPSRTVRGQRWPAVPAPGNARR